MFRSSQLATYLKEEVDKFFKQEKPHIPNLEALLMPEDYVEKWRLLLWDKAFDAYLGPKASPRFIKGSHIDKIVGGGLTKKRLMFRFAPIFFFSIFNHNRILRIVSKCFKSVQVSETRARS